VLESGGVVESAEISLRICDWILFCAVKKLETKLPISRVVLDLVGCYLCSLKSFVFDCLE